MTSIPERELVAVVGSGNIGMDLVEKLRRSRTMELRYLAGIDPASPGLARGRAYGLETSADGVDWLLARSEPPALIFEATSALVHAQHAPRYRRAGLRVIDLTPAALGPFVVPSVNLSAHMAAPNMNMVTCGGQATVPMVHAVSRIVPVDYAEIVASIASLSAGPGTRANIDEFTRTTAKAVEQVGGAKRGKAIIILNPAHPPLMMRDTVICSLPLGANHDAIVASIGEMEQVVQSYVPGYRQVCPPVFEGDQVTIFLEVEGAGDSLPRYAGNLDIMTAAAVRVGEEIVRSVDAASV